MSFLYKACTDPPTGETHPHYVFPHFRDIGEEEQGEDTEDSGEGAGCYSTRPKAK